MDSKAMIVARELRSKISEKYIIHDFRLFGSSARGDQNRFSDIDVFIMLPELNAAIEEDIFDMAYDLELAHDCVIDVIATSNKGVNNNVDISPVYRNILLAIPPGCSRDQT
jgi:predicted nucleotidyltransferase